MLSSRVDDRHVGRNLIPRLIRSHRINPTKIQFSTAAIRVYVVRVSIAHGRFFEMDFINHFLALVAEMMMGSNIAEICSTVASRDVARTQIFVDTGVDGETACSLIALVGVPWDKVYIVT